MILIKLFCRLRSEGAVSSILDMGNRFLNGLVYGLKTLLKWKMFELKILFRFSLLLIKDLLFFLLGSD
jgi:hypothetical protein